MDRPKPKRSRGKGHFTQWAGQFGIATELTRRGYLVGLTLGNTPDTDLFCQHIDSGASFALQVKSLSSKTYFPIANFPAGLPDDLFGLVFVPPKPDQPLEFYIATRDQLRQAAAAYEPTRRRLPEGQPHRPFPDGVAYRSLAPFRDRWEKLPKCGTITA